MSDPSRPSDDVADGADAPAAVVVTHVAEDVLAFDVVVVVPAAEAPRVSVKAGGGARGVVDVVGVEERARAGGVRHVAFRCEAERGPAAFDVVVVVDRPGRPLTTLAGPPVPARG